MAIKEYVSRKDGRITYTVYVEVRGKSRGRRFTRNKAGFATIEEARIVEKKLFKECKDECREKEVQGILWGKLVAEWFQGSMHMRANNPHERLSPETLVDYRSTLLRWTGNHSNTPYSAIGSEVFEELFRKLELLQMSRQHRRRLKRLIFEVFDFGIRKGFIPKLYRSPVENVSVGKGRGKRTEILTVSQVQTLIQNALMEKHPWARVWAFAYLSLMRSQEIYALPWSKVNFENRQILVNQSYCIKRVRILSKVAAEKGEEVSPNIGIKETKTDDWHFVPINDDLLKLLLELRSETGNSEFVFPRNTEWATNKLSRKLRKFCDKSELPSICFHSLRACGATHLIQLGIEPAKVMKLGGWKSLKSMEHYIRQSGIDVKDLNANLRVLPTEMPHNVVPIRANAGDISL